jgi:ABC-2 type transport system permease protein
MKKIWLIIKREYLTRVRKKTFIISTLLFPVLYVALVFGSGYIAGSSKHILKVALTDNSGYFTNAAIDKQNAEDNSSYLQLIKNNTKPDSASFDAFVTIPAIRFDTAQGHSLVLNTKKSYGPDATYSLQAKINKIWMEVKNEKLGIDSSKRVILAQNQITLGTEDIKGQKIDNETAGGLGTAFGFLMYFIILIYGSQVMMGVMEEKTNRIAEIIVSSVKPFQMMLGKIIGIGMVALTQFFLWIIFVLVIYNVTKASGGAGASTANQLVGSVQQIFTTLNLPFILACFLFYFIGGFLFYSAIYGAIGSAVNEDIREAQSLAFPVTMLVIISIVLMTSASRDPNGPVAFWGSMIPFSSPLVMMARIPYGVPGTVPWWQLGLSMAILVAGFLFTTWFAAKIYRTGILMYGKKASWKELIKWAFRKG